MINKQPARFVLFGIFILTFLSLLAGISFPSNAAAPHLAGTPSPGVGATAIVPNTGNQNANAVGIGWIIWAILGIAIIALIIALASSRTTHSDL